MRKDFTKLLASIGAVVAVAALSGAAVAADKPPLKILVGYSPGGGSDTLARVLADEMRQSLGRPVLVENKPGAGGRIAAEALKGSPADGSVVMVAPNGLTSIQSIVYKAELRYDPAKDLVPVAKLVNTPIGVAVSAGTRVQDARQLAGWAKAHPSEANFGSPAAGGLPHFVGLLLGKAIGAPLNHVAYKGGAPVAVALMGGEIPVGVSTIDDFTAHDKAGKINIIGITGVKRSTLVPQIPTLLEQGYEVRADGWTAMWTSPGTPPQQIQEIAMAVQKALDKPAVKAKLALGSMEPDFANDAELARLQKAEWELWTPIINASGFKPGN